MPPYFRLYSDGVVVARAHKLGASRRVGAPRPAVPRRAGRRDTLHTLRGAVLLRPGERGGGVARVALDSAADVCAFVGFDREPRSPGRPRPMRCGAPLPVLSGAPSPLDAPPRPATLCMSMNRLFMVAIRPVLYSSSAALRRDGTRRSMRCVAPLQPAPASLQPHEVLRALLASSRRRSPRWPFPRPAPPQWPGLASSRA